MDEFLNEDLHSFNFCLYLRYLLETEKPNYLNCFRKEEQERLKKSILHVLKLFNQFNGIENGEYKSGMHQLMKKVARHVLKDFRCPCDTEDIECWYPGLEDIKVWDKK